jgi:Flp pilus assembly protein TadD
MLHGVANVVGRSDTLALLFSLLALLTLSFAGRWRGGTAPSPAAHRVAVWSAAAFLFLALTSKEVALATPLLMLVQEALFRFPERPAGRQWWIRRAAGLAPCGLALVVWLVLRTHALGVFPGLQAVPREDNVIVLLDLHGAQRLATALGMAARYAGLLLFPSKLSADYSGTVIRAQDSVLAILPLLGLAFLGALLFLATRPFAGATRRIDERANDARIVAMGAWMFLLPYLVVGNLVVLNAAGFAERLLYVPAAGFFLVVAVLLGRCAAAIPRLALPVGAVIAIVVATSVVHTREQARMWGSARELFERSLEATPRSLRFNLAIGHIHRREGNLELARLYFERNAEYAPTDPGSWSDLGIFLSGTSDSALAEDALRNAIRLDPQRGEAYAHLGKLLRRAGRNEEAERALRKALLLRPDMLISAAELGRLYFDAGRYTEAAFYFRGCVRLGRTDLREMQERAESLARQSAPSRP